MLTGGEPPAAQDFAAQLDHSSPTPLYQQVRNWLLSGIKHGVWLPGAPIPPERKLSVDLAVSRATLRQAVETLVQDGYLVRQHGRGTFVAEPKFEQPLDKLRGFSENMRALGVAAASQLLDARLEPASGNVATALGLEEGAAVAVIKRVRLADGVPLMVESCHLNYERVVGILAHDLTRSLYETLEREYGLALKLELETLEVRPAEAWAARALSWSPVDAVLYTERVTRDTSGGRIEFTRRYARPDRCRFRVGPHDADFTLR